MLLVAKKWADADEADLQFKEDVGQAPRSDQSNRRYDDQRDDRRRDDRHDDRHNDNHDYHDDNRNRRRDRRDDNRWNHNHQEDNTINAVKPGAKRDYDDAYSKVLQGPCPAHPHSDHMMGNCKGLRSIYRSDPRKRMRGGGNDDKRDDKRDDKKDGEEEKTTTVTKILIIFTQTPTGPSAPYSVAKSPWRPGKSAS